ncbi:hypothetical protein M0R45_030885 [Rubus argutus]|uniref:Uncharacterized protein n=1 Tax=Rubus argutus TaxID=59490 RepID=A0AAW1WEF7_RUBAR
MDWASRCRLRRGYRRRQKLPCVIVEQSKQGPGQLKNDGMAVMVPCCCFHLNSSTSPEPCQSLRASAKPAAITSRATDDATSSQSPHRVTTFLIEQRRRRFVQHPPLIPDPAAQFCRQRTRTRAQSILASSAIATKPRSLPPALIAVATCILFEIE